MKLNHLFLGLAMAGAGVLTPAHAENVNPLNRFIGVWEGDQGADVAPAQKKTGATGSAAVSPFYERLEISAGPAATNASEQDLEALTVRQKVFRKSDQQQFHDQVGYLIWDKKNAKVIYSFCVPRGVCVSAEGNLDKKDEFSVSTKTAIAETEFMRQNAKTEAFSMGMTVKPDNTLSYSQITALNIYGKAFSHADSNVLRKVADKPAQ